MALTKPVGETEKLMRAFKQAGEVADVMSRQRERQTAEERDQMELRRLRAESALIPEAEKRDAQREYEAKAAEARAKGQEPPPMPKEVPVSTDGYKGTLGPSDLFGIAEAQTGGGPPAPMFAQPRNALAGTGGTGPARAGGGGVGASAAPGTVLPNPSGFSGQGGGAFGLAPQAPVPAAPGMIGELEVNRGTRQEQLGGPLGPYVPRATENVGMRARPNVLSAAEREALLQRRYEFANEHQLNTARVRASTITGLMQVVPGNVAARLTDDFMANGKFPDLTNVITFPQVQSEQEILRTRDAERRTQIEAGRAAAERTYQLGMLGVAQARENRETWTAGQEAVIQRVKLMADIGRINNDAHFTERAQNIEVEIRRLDRDQQLAIANDDRAAMVEINGKKLALEQQLREMEDKSNNMRHSQTLTADRTNLLTKLHFERGERQLDRVHDINVRGVQGKIDLAIAEAGHTWSLEDAREADHRRFKYSYALAMTGGELDRIRDKNNDIRAAARQEMAQKFQRDYGMEQADAQLLANQLSDESRERIAQLEAVTGDKKLALEQYKAELLYSSQADQRQVIQTRDFLEADARTQRIMLDKYARETTRMGVILPHLEKLRSANTLTPDSLNFGQMAGFDRTKVSDASLGPDIQRLRVDGGNVDENADPGLFYDVAMRMSALQNRVAGIDKNGLQFLTGYQYTGLMAAAYGHAADVTPEFRKQAIQKLKSLNLIEESGGQLIPKRTGATAAWANDAWRTYHQTILGNPAYLNRSFQELKIPPRLRNPETGVVSDIPGAAITPGPGANLEPRMGGPLGDPGTLLLGELQRIVKGSNPLSLDQVESGSGTTALHTGPQ